jgi:hypothetical protein
MVEFKAQGIPAVVLSAPTWEAPCKTQARTWKLSEKQVVAVPIGQLFPDSQEAGKVIAEHMIDILPYIIAGLKEASMMFSTSNQDHN